MHEAELELLSPFSCVPSFFSVCYLGGRGLILVYNQTECEVKHQTCIQECLQEHQLNPAVLSVCSQQWGLLILPSPRAHNASCRPTRRGGKKGGMG